MRNMKTQKKYDHTIILILLGVAITHIMLLFNDFHTDDWQILILLRDGFSRLDFISMENLSNFRPVTNIVILLRTIILGNNPSLWYMLNIILHLAIVYLLYVFTKKRFGKTAAISAALFFGIYFQHFEGVLWAYGIVRLISALAIFTCIYYFIEYHDNQYKYKLYLSYLFFALAIYMVEDILIFAALLTIAPFIIERTPIRRGISESSGYWIIAVVYLTTRFMAIGWGDPSTEYYFIGVHALKNLYSYIVWIAIPDLSHPYLKTYTAAYAPFVLPYIKFINLTGFISVMTAFGILLFKGNRLERFFIVFILASLILPSFYENKISTKLLYIPSLGIAVLFGSLFSRLYEAWNVNQRRILTISFSLYLVIQAIAINITIYAYRQNHNEVRQIGESIEQLNIDWNNYDYLVLDNIPGRARPGHYLKYRFGFDIHLILNNEQTEDLPSLDNERKKLRQDNLPYIYINYNRGHPIIMEQSYQEKDNYQDLN